MPPFLQLLNSFIISIRLCGLMPLNALQGCFSNFLHYTVVTILLMFNFYIMTYKLGSTVALLLERITASSCFQLAMFIYIYLAFASVVFVAKTGQKRKLEHFSDLLHKATGQRALEKKYETIRRKVYFWAVIISVIIVSVAAFLPLIFSKFADDWQGVEAFRTILFVNVWYTNAFVAIAVTFNAVANGMCLLINIIACECLKQEFHHLNCQLRRINIRDNESFKKVALEHSRLLKCLDYLHEYLSVYVFICLAVITIMTIIFAYMLMLDIAPPLRFLAGLWIISNSVIAFVFCNSAETLHITAKEARALVCYKMTEEHSKGDLKDEIYKTAHLITQQASVDMTFTAIGFFAVSKETLLAILSFVATYVVILLQTPKVTDERATPESMAMNGTISAESRARERE